jgi:segregation and condensation protein B
MTDEVLDGRPVAGGDAAGEPADGVADGGDGIGWENDGPGDGTGATGDGTGATGDGLELAGTLSETQLEALLFVAEKPLSRREIGLIAGVDRATVDERLGDLEVALAGRGIRLALSGDRVELVTAPEAGALVARYVGTDAVRLTPATLETLAIVAYRQPVTKGGVERIRGVDSDYSIRALLHRRLVTELGRSEAPGRPILYGTGFEFLERFGITSLDDLPPLDLDVAARLVDGPDGSGDQVPDLAGTAGSTPPATVDQDEED